MREWLKDCRRRKGLTQEKVAEKAGISRSFYVQLENEKYRKGLSVNTAKSLAKVLDFEWTAFYPDDAKTQIS